MIHDQDTVKREEVVIVGGGLGGVLSALMLAKNPRFHVTLVEAKHDLFTGASEIASRLHLGGEYPLSPDTANDCVRCAATWKLLMPKTIYTSVTPMKFLLATENQREGMEAEHEWKEALHDFDSETDAGLIQAKRKVLGEKALAYKRTLTLKTYSTAYENVRLKYKELVENISNGLQWSEQKVQDTLFGSYNEYDEKNPKSNDWFFRPLKREEYADYDQPAGSIAGGFQTRELGLNVPKYLIMLEKELRSNPRITVLTDHKVVQNGIQGKNREFSITCENGTVLHANQVVEATWRKGAEVTPLPKDNPNLPPGTPTEVKVHKRAMVLWDLGEGWQTGPAFIMLGKNGGMLSPYNDKTAVTYLPVEGAAYRKSHTLTADHPTLPEDWDTLPEKDRAEWTERYATMLKARFPALKNAKAPQIIIQDTITFQEDLEKRYEEEATEAVISVPTEATLGKPTMEQKPELAFEPEERLSEIQPGWFKLYPTKATYAVNTAVQVADMVARRGLHPEIELIRAEKHTLPLFASPQGLKKYSLGDMKEPTRLDYEKFYQAHPNHKPAMHVDSWPEKNAHPWIASNVRNRG